MEQVTKNVTMAESVKPIKISEKEYERLQKFGFAGESINTALKRVLDIAENHKENLKTAEEYLQKMPRK